MINFVIAQVPKMKLKRSNVHTLQIYNNSMISTPDKVLQKLLAGINLVKSKLINTTIPMRT